MLKILMMMRPNALTSRGGDTVVMENLRAQLLKMGQDVTVDIEMKSDLAPFDVVHLFNFATPEITELQARKCTEARKPFVITTLYEDWPNFFKAMVLQEMILTSYVKYDQPADVWEKFKYMARGSTSADIQDNFYSALTANILLSSGYNESVSLRRDYPEANCVDINYFGSEISSYSDGGELFRAQSGFKDFILCVGRLEQRKNQLSLLKAFEDSPLPIVFAAGGFTYEPGYEATCRKFKRAGKTLFLNRVSIEMLASAYEAASVHALPSWYELPGLVSLEAAARGAPTVVTDFGTVRDYLQDGATYCQPWDVEGIRKSVELAMCKGRNSDTQTKERIAGFTWEGSARSVVEFYKKALDTPLRMTIEEIEARVTACRDSIGPQRLEPDFKEKFPHLADLLHEKRALDKKKGQAVRN